MYGNIINCLTQSCVLEIFGHKSDVFDFEMTLLARTLPS